MFHRGSFFIRFLLALLVIGLLFAGGAALYRYGFTQGYTQAVIIAANEGNQTTPAVPINPGWIYAYPPMHWGFFPGFPLFGLVLIGFLLFAALGFLFRPRHWGHSPMGAYPGHWHGHESGWGTPPWAREGTGGQSGSEPESDAQGKSPTPEKE